MNKRIIIAGGGTGGHIFPALAIANALKQQQPGTVFLFVGAKGKMEMEKVPQAGYEIVGLDIAGFNRSSLWKNVSLPVKLIKSFFQVRRIFKDFKPDAVIGVGGYSTFPVLRQAQAKGIPTFIHESNSFAGKANKMLGSKATKVFTGTDGMEKFFPANKILVTGNPVRKQIVDARISKTAALQFFGLGEKKITLLVVGGSLGARSINEAVSGGLDDLLAAGMQVIWQTGKSWPAQGAETMAEHKDVWVRAFIAEMEYAYAAADVIIARAGAMTVAEVCVIKKPAIFVPYPYAADDHQTINARRLVDKQAALMVKDAMVKEQLVPAAIGLAKDEGRRNMMAENLSKLAITNAAQRVAEEIFKVI